MSVHNAVLAELERVTTIGDAHGSTPFNQPMTVVQQYVPQCNIRIPPLIIPASVRLLAQMVMALSEYVEHPSEECMCKWDDIAKGYSEEYLPFDERENMDG